MLEQLDLKLKELDISMSKILKNIKNVYIPNEEDLNKLFELYQLTIDCYMQNNTIYNLEPLKHTNLKEVVEILILYGHLINNIIKQDKKSIVQSDSISVDTSSKALDNENIDDIFIQQKDAFNSNGPVYAFSNEALNQYMGDYDFKGKKVLASLGSGDFALNSYLLGASSVDTFDINQYTYYFYQLKKALILNYEYYDFCNLIKNPIHIFEHYNEYKHLLDMHSRMFFENLVKSYKGNFQELLRKVYIDKVGEEKNQYNESNTFDTFEELFLIAQYKNFYLQSPDNYNKLKKSLNMHDDEFHFVNLFEFNPNKKYDIVYLSNIGDYCKNEEEFKEFVECSKEKFLNDGGIIIIVSITNHIYMNSDEAERRLMNWDEIEEFNKLHKGVAVLPICNLGLQNVYTTYPYEKKNYHEFN